MADRPPPRFGDVAAEHREASKSSQASAPLSAADATAPSQKGVSRRALAIVGNATAGLDVFSTIALRAVSMGFGLVANVVAIRLLTGRFSADGYALFALISSVLAALPFADLGIGASIVNSTADLAAGSLTRRTYGALLRSATRIVVGVATGLSLLAVYLGSADHWSFLVGSLVELPYVNVSLTIVSILTACSIPLGLGARVLQGLGRSIVTTRWSLATGPFQLLAFVVLFVVHAQAAWYAVGAAVSIFLTNLLVSRSALRSLRIVVPKDDASDSSGATNLLSSAAPYLITLLSSTVAFQADRSILVHVSSSSEVAKYSLLAQFIIPSLSIIVLASQNLWPRFRTQMAVGGVEFHDLKVQVGIYAAIGAIAATLTAVFLLAGSHFISNGEISIGLPPLAFAASYLVLASAHRPIGMMLSDSYGLWWQAICGVLTAGLSVVLTFVWGRSFGAAGAYAASAVAVVSLQLIPLAFVSKRALDRTNCRR